MGDTRFRELKETYGMLNPSAKIDLVEALRREKEKAERQIANVKAQREKAKEEGLKNKIVVDPSASRPFKELMVKAGANHPSLTKLDFSVGAWWLSGADVLALADVLKRNSTVTDINFHGNSLAAQGATAMAEMLQTNTSITSLNLGGNQITSVGAKSLADSVLSHTCALRSLLLYNNSISDEGVQALAFALGGTQVVASGRNKGATVYNAHPNTTLTTLDLSSNVMTCKGATSLAACLSQNVSLTHLHLAHNVLRDAGAQEIRAAIDTNTSLLKLTTEGNNFDELLRHQMQLAVKHNAQMRSLALLQAQNEREFERVRQRVQPAEGSGMRSPQHACEIDLARTDPRTYAATQQALMLTARAKEQESTVLQERATAVLAAAAAGSNRAMLALYRMSIESEEAVEELVGAGGVSVALQLVALGAGKGSTHEAAEALRQCLAALHAMLKASNARLCDALPSICALVDLLTMDMCSMEHLLDTYTDNDPSGPLLVQEEATRGVCMAVMAASLRIINLLCTSCPAAGVAAATAVAAGLMPKLLFLSMPFDEDARVLSREVRIESLKVTAVVGRYAPALPDMPAAMQQLVACVADADAEVQLAAAHALTALLDPPPLSPRA